MSEVLCLICSLLYWLSLCAQAADIPEHDFYLQTCEEETSQNKETHEDEAVPESFSFYETLMDAKPNPDVLEPVGEDCGFNCSGLLLQIFFKPYKHWLHNDPIVKGNISVFLSYNRNSNSCSNAGTHAEEPQCLQGLQTKT